jgi:hypothetical protein
MLSFQMANSGKAIQVDCDRQGLETLISALQKIQSKEADHIHLRAPSAGGHTLSDITPWGNPAIGEVIITTGGDDEPA